jgi:hypothetical protein
MKIGEIVARENLFAPGETSILREDVRRYLCGSIWDQNEFLGRCLGKQISPPQLHSFFLQHEREENSRLTLQYLLMFLEKSSSRELGISLPEAAVQLAEFVKFKVDLLLQDDVRRAILRNGGNSTFPQGGRFLISQERIDETHQELSASLPRRDGDSTAIVRQLCRVLEKLCLFWFEICGEDLHRVRLCDFLTYKLALILQYVLGSPQALEKAGNVLSRSLSDNSKSP